MSGKRVDDLLAAGGWPGADVHDTGNFIHLRFSYAVAEELVHALFPFLPALEEVRWPPESSCRFRVSAGAVWDVAADSVCPRRVGRSLRDCAAMHVYFAWQHPNPEKHARPHSREAPYVWIMTTFCLADHHSARQVGCTICASLLQDAAVSGSRACPGQHEPGILLPQQPCVQAPCQPPFLQAGFCPHSLVCQAEPSAQVPSAVGNTCRCKGWPNNAQSCSALALSSRGQTQAAA